MIVVDTNIISYLYLPTNRTPLAERLLENEPTWVAPLLWRSEFRNVLTLYLRRKAIPFETSLAIMEEAESQLRNREYEVASLKVLSLTSGSKCSAYDCEFVAVAEALNVPLVTEDKAIIKNFPNTAISMRNFLPADA